MEPGLRGPHAVRLIGHGQKGFRAAPGARGGGAGIPLGFQNFNFYKERSSQMKILFVTPGTYALQTPFRIGHGVAVICLDFAVFATPGTFEDKVLQDVALKALRQSDPA